MFRSLSNDSRPGNRLHAASAMYGMCLGNVVAPQAAMNRRFEKFAARRRLLAAHVVRLRGDGGSPELLRVRLRYLQRLGALELPLWNDARLNIGTANRHAGEDALQAQRAAARDLCPGNVEQLQRLQFHQRIDATVGHFGIR